MRIISRSEWGARAPRSRSRRFLNNQSPTVHYNGQATRLHAGSTEAEERAFMRSTQNFHMDGRGWSDLAYNFVVFPSGRIYEGRGWGIRSAANGTTIGNTRSYAFMAAIGQGQSVTMNMIASFIYLRDQANKKALMGHRDHKNTGCPGEALYRLTKDGTFAGKAPTVTDEIILDVWDLSEDITPSSSEAEVKALQKYLGVTVDGDYGPLTSAAVRGAQTGHGMDTPTGVWTFASKPPRAYKIVVSRWLPFVLRVGVPTGSATRMALHRRVQRALGDIIKIDGVFDRELEAYVRGFQAATGLTVDGIVGKQTWGTIFAGKVS